MFQKEFKTIQYDERKAELDIAKTNLKQAEGYWTLHNYVMNNSNNITINIMFDRLLYDIYNGNLIDSNYYFGMDSIPTEIVDAMTFIRNPIVDMYKAEKKLNETQGYYVGIYKNNGETDNFNVTIDSNYVGEINSSVEVEKNLIGFGFINMNQWKPANDLKIDLISTILADGVLGFAANKLEVINFGKSVNKLLDYGKDRLTRDISNTMLSNFKTDKDVLINNAQKLYAGIDKEGLDKDNKKLLENLENFCTILALASPTTLLGYLTIETFSLGLVYVLNKCKSAISAHNGDIALDYYESRLDVNGKLPIELLIPERTSYTDVCEMSKFGSNTLVADLIDKNIVSGSEPSRGSGFKDSKLIA